jgi:hypothetical protein
MTGVNVYLALCTCVTWPHEYAHTLASEAGNEHANMVNMYQTLSRVPARPQKKSTVSLRNSGVSTLLKADSSICSKFRCGLVMRSGKGGVAAC